MLIHELKGYKLDPLYVLLQNSDSLEDFKENLTREGYLEIVQGVGYYSVVFAQPNNNEYVVKLFHRDRGYEAFLRAVAAKPGIYLPRIKGRPISLKSLGKHDWRLLRIERLEAIKHGDLNKIKTYNTMKLWTGNPHIRDDQLKFVRQSYLEVKNQQEEINNNFPGLYDTCKYIRNFSGEAFHIDLHRENIMFRGDTPVITDPYNYK